MDATLVRLPALAARFRGLRDELAPHYRSMAAALKAGSDGMTLPFGVWRSPGSVTVAGASGLHPELARAIDELAAALPEYDTIDAELWFNEGGRVFPHNDAAFWLHTGRAQALQLWLLLDAIAWTRDGHREAQQTNALRCWVPMFPGLVFPFVPHGITTTGTAEVRLEHAVSASEIGDCLLFKNGVVHDKPRQTSDAPVLRVALGLRLVRKEDRPLVQDRRAMRFFARRFRDEPELVRNMGYSPYFRELLAAMDDQQATELPEKVDQLDLAATAAALGAAFSAVRPPS